MSTDPELILHAMSTHHTLNWYYQRLYYYKILSFIFIQYKSMLRIPFPLLHSKRNEQPIRSHKLTHSIFATILLTGGKARWTWWSRHGWIWFESAGVTLEVFSGRKIWTRLRCKCDVLFRDPTGTERENQYVSHDPRLPDTLQSRP